MVVYTLGSSAYVVIVEADLPTSWNQHGDAYCFVYKHSQSSMTFVVKSLVMNDRLLVHGVAKEDDKICSLELRYER